jgi:hypothetical protein
MIIAIVMLVLMMLMLVNKRIDFEAVHVHFETFLMR